MKKNTLKLASTFCLIEILQFATITPVWSQDSAIDSLLEQAQYWHDKSNLSLANESLQKVLMVDPDQPQALYFMSLWAKERGDNEESQQWRSRLEKAHPNAPELEQFTRSQTLSQLSNEGIEKARREAQSGDIKASIATWDKLFDGKSPPLALAPEYYLTMSGDKSMVKKAETALGKLARQYPSNSAVGIAYGQVLTYTKASRRNGLKQLEKYTQSSETATNALREALLWLDPKASDEQYYQRWKLAHPDDNQVFEHFRSKISGNTKKTGFDELNRGNLKQAKLEFQKVLDANPNDADALAGLGYISLNQGDYTQAAAYLNRSASKGGNQAAKRRKQASEAKFFAELDKAKAEYKSGNITKALELTFPLIKFKGENGRSAKLFRADILRHNGDYAQAESLLQNVLNEDKQNQPAKEALYYVLIEQNQEDKARELLSSLSLDVQTRIRKEDKYSDIRDLAKMAVDAGNVESAIVILDNGLELLPNNPWLRLELARLYTKQSDSSKALEIISPLMKDDANEEDLYAAALFYSGQDQWKKSNQILARIPTYARTPQAKSLYDESKFNLSLELATSYISSGKTIEAKKVLKSLREQAIEKPSWAGRLAQLLIKTGSSEDALEIIDENQSLGISGNASDYAAQISVLYQTGFKDKAEDLLNNPTILANSTPLQIAQARNIYIINQSDSLRKGGKFAEAYDILTAALQINPKNTDLMLAIGRLYQSGKLNDNAQSVYQYLLDNDKDTPEQDALVGAINIALLKGNVEKAVSFSEQLKQVTSPDRLLLLARIEEAKGGNAKAMAYLRQARSKLLGLEEHRASTSAMVGGMVLADNPFLDASNASNSSSSQSVYGTTMPWQVESGTSSNGNALYQRTDLPELTENQQLLADVNRLALQISEKTTWVKGGVEIRSRDGESGLSRLTEARTPMEWSTVPFGDARLSINLAAVTLDAGTSSGDANRRFGTGALIQGEVAQSEGVSTLNGDTLPDVDSQGSQQQRGIEIGMSLRDEYYALDIGTTPLGADLTTLVGGVQLNAPLDDYLGLSFSLERRAVKDSMLSYVGTKDSFSGQYWGQVTQNGINIQLNFDDGDVGYYAGTGFWRYAGKNVKDNNALKVEAGMYLRPYESSDRQLQIGSHIGFQNFDENLSYYSFGHGGYSSPQNYISVSFPVEYKQEFSKLSLALGGALGYQSYRLDEADYFPSQSAWQSTLESYVTSGLTEEAQYAADGANGVGYSFQASLSYKMKRDLILEASIAYDTFGDYNESKANLSLKHSFEQY